MKEKLKRYEALKQQQKELEQELSELRQQILDYAESQGSAAFEIEGYKVQVVLQERKEYDEQKLYEALPDPELWRMLAKPDSSKIASLIKLKVIPEERLAGTYAVKRISLLKVEKK
ncbi:hypothetical protein DCC85_04185 [Paenibacillus sp. CAA11]|uniref:hypothetical protein n=1 Tax=Paenibacillus sp. CAA11 TaxID=1532905 RepID=UPI000D3564B7|nr:hypothetical protein [Paenibacillus sp. CAA11]AWB43499.1 hypothetical protein DCC85_04185 [Paenibacillus sp. CAA11]